jgi:hypothetical protein
MLVVRKIDRELRDKFARGSCRVLHVTETWKKETSRVARSHLHVAVRADQWRGSLSRKELCSVTIQTGRVFRKFCDVLECSVPFSNFLPVLRWEEMTCVTFELCLVYVSRMRKSRIVDARFFGSRRFRTIGGPPRLRFNFTCIECRSSPRESW